jgi:hypothetical protein
MTPGTRIPDRKYDIAGKLVLNVEIELLYATLLKVQILRLDRPRKTA